MDNTPLLSDCVIKFVNLLDNLICIIELNGIEYKAKISQSDLKLVSVVKLQRIIQSNHKQTQQHYTINLTHQSNSITNTNYLVMDICYSGDIDFDEKIIFTQSSLQEETTSNTQLKKLTKSLQLKQTEQCDVIDFLKLKQIEHCDIINTLKEKINKLEQEQIIFLELKDDPNCGNYMPYNLSAPKNRQLMTGNLLVPKNIDKLHIQNGRQSAYFYFEYNLFGENLYCCIPYIPIKHIQNNNKIILFPYLYFNFKKIYIKNDNSYGRYDKNITFFIDEYLLKKNDFTVDKITVANSFCSVLIPILLKYNNYKKLLIEYNKEFDDRDIISHCKSNNIEFDYLLLN